MYQFYPGKVKYKKRKPPAAPEMSVVSGKYARISMLSKPAKKKSCTQWICAYCDITYDEDVAGNTNMKWIQCDNCQMKMHINCTPRAHLSSQNFDFEEEENYFKCEKCLSEEREEVSE